MPSAYYEMSNEILMPDYYGFVRNGMIEKISCEGDLDTTCARW